MLGQKSKKGFFKELIRLDGPGGEGLAIEQMVNIVMVGLRTGIPDITYKKAEGLCQDFINEYGEDALEDKLTDAFVDAGISDRKEVRKQREHLERIKAAQEKMMEAAIQKKEVEVEKLVGETIGASEFVGTAEPESSLSSQGGVSTNETVDEDTPLEN